MAPRPHGAEVYIIRASGAEQEVTLNDGKFATAVFDGETVTIGLKMYNGTDGVFATVPFDYRLGPDAWTGQIGKPDDGFFFETSNFARFKALVEARVARRGGARAVFRSLSGRCGPAFARAAGVQWPKGGCRHPIAAASKRVEAQQTFCSGVYPQYY